MTSIASTDKKEADMDKMSTEEETDGKQTPDSQKSSKEKDKAL